MGKKHYYTPEEEDIIRRNYPTMSNHELAKMIGVSTLSVFNKANAMGLHKDSEWLRATRAESAKGNVELLKPYWFKRGHVSANRGKKLSEATRKKIENNMYRPGHIPHNAKYDGAETIRKDKTGREYVFVRVSSGKWVPKHVLLWKKAYGEIPKKHNVVFKDGNTRNITLDNLELVSNGELMRRNSLHNNYPQEVCQLIQLKGVLKRQINSNSKKRKYD